MDINILLAIVGTVVGAVSLVVTFLQLRYQLLDRAVLKPSESSEQSQEHGSLFSVFAAYARVLGMTRTFVNRVSEIRTLRNNLDNYKQHVSIITITGIAGTGKSTLASKIVQSLSRKYRKHSIRWVFCAEHQLTLLMLARSIAFDDSLRRTDSLKTIVLTESVPTSRLIDALLEYLSKEKLVLVLDNVQVIEDDSLRKFFVLVAASQIESVLILTSREKLGYLKLGDSVFLTELGGLTEEDSIELLQSQGVLLDTKTYRKIYERTGGNPQALEILVGLETTEHMYELVDGLPIYNDDFFAWVEELFRRLTQPEIKIVKFITFMREPVTYELLVSLLNESDVQTALKRLVDKLIIDDYGATFALHDIFEEYARLQLTDVEQHEYAKLITSHFRNRARALLRGGEIEPSYGLAYMEAHPDYVEALDRHEKFVENLFSRLAENGFSIDPGANALVLGAGHGTHDAGLSKVGLNLLNVDFTEETVKIGIQNAKSLPTRIDYLIADMTEPLDIPSESFDIAFNIGSSFGFEDEDSKNAMIFQNAFTALKPGSPFVFEYVNGYYYSNVVSRDLSIFRLPNGSIRTKYGIKNPFDNTSLTTITLERTDGTQSHFYHFMHYYTADEVIDMMKRAGFNIRALYGSIGLIQGEFVKDKSHAMIIIAQKPGASQYSTFR